MKMLLYRTIAGALILSPLCIFADTIIDPIRSYVKLANLPQGRTVYRWELDLNHDGRKEILLEAEPTPEELAQQERENNWNPETRNEHGFTVYIPKGDKTGYIECKGTDFGTRFQLGTGLSVNIRRCFVGMITQLDRWGLVTIEIEQEEKGSSAIATVSAYTLEGDHLKLTVLAKYNPKTESNAIFDQYLSDSKRTKVKLEEIVL